MRRIHLVWRGEFELSFRIVFSGGGFSGSPVGNLADGVFGAILLR
jgi:hypothetical protein